jgi:hypothetical protein
MRNRFVGNHHLRRKDGLFMATLTYTVRDTRDEAQSFTPCASPQTLYIGLVRANQEIRWRTGLLGTGYHEWARTGRDQLRILARYLKVLIYLESRRH